MRYVVCLLIVFSSAEATRAAAPRIDYVRQIKPILAARCFACHGALKQEAGLRLDTGSLIRRGNESGPAVVPGQVGNSPLVERITDKDESVRMPPEGKPLTSQQIALIKAWIRQGASSPKGEPPQSDPRKHWSFQPPTRPAVPQVANSRWVANPIDAFVAARHERKGLKPNPPADKATLLRRVYLDLIGLPPTASELHDFLADDSAQAYKRVVDRLLASPRYGERWGRHWMDVWRYSDWHGSGNEIRYGQRHLWRWRDWIVSSLNADKGYDRMLLEMLAADEVAPTDPRILPATGFIGRNWYKFDRNVWMRELVEHTAAGFLAVTMKCARCHDHKFDPLSQEEYYRFRAFFEPHGVRVDRITSNTATAQGTKPGAVPADGIPRAYDKTLDAPSYVFRRGDDRYPDKERPLKPGVPSALGGAFDVRPVALPAAAYIPDLQPHLVRDRIQLAETAVARARNERTRAEQAVAVAREQLKQAHSGKTVGRSKRAFPIVYRDDFSAPNQGAWNTLSGKWDYKNGKLIQSQVGTFLTRVLQTEHPQDLLVRLRFTPTSAGSIHSVGVGFDVVPGKHMQAIYTWIPKGRSGVSAFHRENGKETYPTSAIVPFALKLNEEITLDFAARGSLLNVWVNGKLAIVHRMPMARRPGCFSLWNHSGTAEYSELQIARLPESVRLSKTRGEKLASPFVDAKPKPLDEVLADSVHTLRLAGLKLEHAEAQLAAVRSRISAEQAKHASGSDKRRFETLAKAAARDERRAAYYKAKLELQQSEAQLANLNRNRDSGKAPSKALIAAQKQHATAKKRAAAAKAALSLTDGKYTPYSAAYPTTSTGRRSALARWMTDRNNPRTARVAVNHIWLRHFNRAIVESVADFGLRSKPRSHPELLDWLAVELIEHRWSMKHIHRLIVTSNTYRMSSRPPKNSKNSATDPDNRFLWRMNSRRMEAEVVRDSVLYLAGTLDLKQGGPSIPATKGQSVPRRSLYFQTAPNRQMPFLKLFDTANPDECYARKPSVIPQQSLALMNSTLAIDNARRLARRLTAQLEKQNSNDDDRFVKTAFAGILNRPPSRLELKRCRDFLQEQMRLLKRKGNEPVFPGAARATVAPSPEPAMRARENLAHVLFNHNEFVTVR